MPTYAADTSVSSDRSQQEIQKTLRRYGADQFMMGWTSAAAVVGFAMNNRQIKFVLPMPDRDAREFTHTPSKGLRRTPTQQDEAWEQACRQRWRALNLVIKAKLEAVEAHISTFEAEFLAQIMLPNGSTVGETVGPWVEEAYATNAMPGLLPQMRALEA
jgi:hypothetical protein